MPLTTLLISGPTRGGKTTVARLIAERVLSKRPVHLLRLKAAHDGYTNAVTRLDGSPDDDRAQDQTPIHEANGWASMHRATYTPDRVFETIPEGLRAVRRLERRGFTIVEADGDPAIRHAYPYDYRVFVMPAPQRISDVFREPHAAAVALQEVMQDTAAFASEIFGLFDGDGLDDSAGVRHHKECPSRARATGSAPVERLDIGEAQIRQFLRSPIGVEIASRIQLQPEYHPLVEADVAVINAGLCEPAAILDECIGRIEKLLCRIRHDARRQSVLYWGNITDARDPAYHQLVKRFRTLLSC